MLLFGLDDESMPCTSGCYGDRKGLSMMSTEYEAAAANRRANTATALSMVAAIAIVIVVFVAGASSMKTGLLLIGGGLSTQLFTNLFARFLIVPIQRREAWAYPVLTVTMIVGLLAISSCHAGVFVLMASAVRWVWHAVLG